MPGDTHQKKHVKKNYSNSNIKFEYADLNNGQNYAIIEKPFGQCRFQIKIINTGEAFVSMLRGKFRGKKGKQRIDIGDIVIITEGNASEILYKYSKDEIKRLSNEGLIDGIKSKNSDECSIIFIDEINTHEIDDEGIDISAI